MRLSYDFLTCFISFRSFLATSTQKLYASKFQSSPPAGPLSILPHCLGAGLSEAFFSVFN